PQMCLGVMDARVSSCYHGRSGNTRRIARELSLGPLGLLAPSLGLGPPGPALRAVQNRSRRFCRTDGPGRIRTYDQGIHSAPTFPPGVDYLFTRERSAPPDPATRFIREGAGCSCL